MSYKKYTYLYNKIYITKIHHTVRFWVNITQKSASEFFPANPLQEEPTRCKEASENGTHKGI